MKAEVQSRRLSGAMDWYQYLLKPMSTNMYCIFHPSNFIFFIVTEGSRGITALIFGR